MHSAVKTIRVDQVRQQNGIGFSPDRIQHASYAYSCVQLTHTTVANSSQYIATYQFQVYAKQSFEPGKLAA